MTQLMVECKKRGGFMFKYNEKIQLIKDTIGTRQKYHEIITNHDFTDLEKDILLQASANVKHTTVDQKLINEAYNILLLKSIVSTNTRNNSTTNFPFIKLLFIVGFLSIVFYIMTPNNFEKVNTVETLEQKEIVPKQEIEESRYGNVSGQGFLRTQAVMFSRK